MEVKYFLTIKMKAGPALAKQVDNCWYQERMR